MNYNQIRARKPVKTKRKKRFYQLARSIGTLQLLFEIASGAAKDRIVAPRLSFVCSKTCSTIPHSAKIHFIRVTPYHWQPLVLKLFDIRKV